MTTITIDRTPLEQIMKDLDSGRYVVPASIQHKQLRAALAAQPSVPAWHDAPTCPGLWATVDGRHASAVVIPKHELSLYQKTTTRWFGPIPPDGDKP